MFKNYELTLDIATGDARHPLIQVNTNDLDSFKISFIITQHKEPVDLTGKTIRIAILKPDRKTVLQDCTLTDAENGKGEVILDTQAYALGGKHYAEVMVYDGLEKVAVTGRFVYNANRGILNDGTVESTNEWQSINQAIADAENILIDLRENGTGVDAQAREDLESVTAQLAQTQTEVEAKITSKSQEYKTLYDKLGSKPTENIFIRKTTNDRVEVFINHYEDLFQRWRLTREDYVYDIVPTVKAFLNDSIFQSRLYKTSVNIEHADTKIIKNGTWTESSTNIYSNTIGDSIEFTFFGSELLINHLTSSNAGIAKITIDGRADLVNQIPLVNGEALYDMYGTGSSATKTLARGLSNTWHTVRVEVTGTKNETATDTRVYFRFFRYMYPPFTNNDMTVTGISETQTNLPDGEQTFRQGTSAIEMAISNTLNGNNTWSGSIHGNLYLTSDPVFYVDGFQTDILSFANGTFIGAKDLTIVQNMNLINGTTDIASVEMTYNYSKDGLVVSWDLEWLVDIKIDASYACMYGTRATKIKFGGNNKTFVMTNDDVSKGNEFTDHIIGFRETNDYMIILELLDYLGSVNDYKDYNSGMFVWDRAKDAKLYAPKFKGDVIAGTTWKSIYRCAVKHVYNIGKLIS